ncbi:hypothetical protein PMAYCL1PPCAC_22625, partial [Pristionchus mayeri]
RLPGYLVFVRTAVDYANFTEEKRGAIAACLHAVRTRVSSPLYEVIIGTNVMQHLPEITFNYNEQKRNAHICVTRLRGQTEAARMEQSTCERVCILSAAHGALEVSEP